MWIFRVFFSISQWQKSASLNYHNAHFLRHHFTQNHQACVSEACYVPVSLSSSFCWMWPLSCLPDFELDTTIIIASVFFYVWLFLIIVFVVIIHVMADSFNSFIFTIGWIYATYNVFICSGDGYLDCCCFGTIIKNNQEHFYVCLSELACIFLLRFYLEKKMKCLHVELQMLSKCYQIWFLKWLYQFILSLVLWYSLCCSIYLPTIEIVFYFD